MKGTVTRSFLQKTITKLGMALVGVAFGTYAMAQTTYVPMSFLANGSYNKDVVADGNPPMPPAVPTGQGPNTTADACFDVSFANPPTSTGYYLTAPNWGGVINPSTPPNGSLPWSGTITSIQNQIPYTLGPLTTPGNNVLQLSTSKTSDTFLFTNTTYMGDIYLLGAAGGSASNATVYILYADNTSGIGQTVTFPDWFNLTDPDTAAVGIGRVRNIYNFNTCNCDARTPRLFDIRVPIPFNAYKPIRGVRIVRTSGGFINVLAATVADNPCLPVTQVFPPATPPTPAVTITSANTIRWKSVAGSAGYEYALVPYPTMPSPLPTVPPTTATFITTTDTFVNYPSGLTPNTPYVFFVRNKCSVSGTDRSYWNKTSFTTPDCAVVPFSSITVVNPPAGSGTTTNSVHVKWCKSCIITAASPTHFGFEYAFTTTNTPPASGTFVNTPPGDTVFNFTGLQTDRPYYFWVRNYCTPPAYGQWNSQRVLPTLQCPPVGIPYIVTNVPESARIQWTGSTDPAVTTYQYQLALGATGAMVHSNWINTTDTFVNLTGLNPGQFYKFWVRAYCSDTGSRFPRSVILPNPYYDCYTPDTPVITNVNIHGAQIDWGRGTSAAPYSIIKHNVAVTLNSVPPFAKASIFPAHNPPANFYHETTDTFFHPTTLSANTTYYVHVRTHCDSVRFPASSDKYSDWVTDTFTTPAVCVNAVIPTINNITAHSAHVEWNLYPGIDGYEYYIDQLSTDPVTPPTWPLITYNQVDPINLQSNTQYYFHLRTKCDNVNGGTYSTWSNTPFTTLPLCNVAPPTPSVVSPVPATSAVFNWQPFTDANSYDVAVTPTSATPALEDATVTIGTYTALNLTPNTDYYFHLKANCSPNDETSWTSIPFHTGLFSSVSAINNGVSVLVYPNPVNDNLTVDIQNNPKGTLQVIDLTGKVLFSTETKGQKNTIDMSGYASGMYLIKYFVDNGNMQMIRVQKR